MAEGLAEKSWSAKGEKASRVNEREASWSGIERHRSAWGQNRSNKDDYYGPRHGSGRGRAWATVGAVSTVTPRAAEARSGVASAAVTALAVAAASSVMIAKSRRTEPAVTVTVTASQATWLGLGLGLGLGF